MMVDPGGSEFPVNKLSNCHPTPIALGSHPVGTSSGLVLPCIPDGVRCVCVCATGAPPLPGCGCVTVLGWLFAYCLASSRPQLIGGIWFPLPLPL